MTMVVHAKSGRSGSRSSSSRGGGGGGSSRRPTRKSSSSKASKKQPVEKVNEQTSKQQLQVDEGGMPINEADELLKNYLATSGGVGGGGNDIEAAAAAAAAAAETSNNGMKHSFQDVAAEDPASNGNGNKRTKRISDACAATLTDPTSNVTTTNTDSTTGPPTINHHVGSFGGGGGDAYADGQAFHGGGGDGGTNFDPEALVHAPDAGGGAGGGKEGETIPTDHHTAPTATTNEDSGGEGEDDEDPDWDAIMKHEPARSDVPVFLDAREGFDAAKSRFRTTLDDYNAALKQCNEGLLNVPVGIYTAEEDKLRAMEENLKQGFVRNAEKRETIEENLRKSAEAAQGLFASLLMKVGTVGGRGGGGGGGRGNN